GRTSATRSVWNVARFFAPRLRAAMSCSLSVWLGVVCCGCFPGRSEHRQSVHLEVVERLLAPLALVERLAGGGAEARDLPGMQRVAARALHAKLQGNRAAQLRGSRRRRGDA